MWRNQVETEIEGKMAQGGWCQLWFFSIGFALARKKINLILEVKIGNQTFFDQEILVAANWHFKEKFVSVTTKMDLNWDSLFQNQEWDSQLDEPFTNEETRTAVFNFNGEGAPGPDGFPFRFFQTYWDIVNEDICDMHRGIYLGKFHAINYSWIIFIAKRTWASNIKDLDLLA